jgi:amidase
LEDAGYAFEEVDEVPRLEDALDAYGRMIPTEFALGWPMVRTLLTEEGRRYIELFMEQRPPIGLGRYVQLTAARFGIQRDWARFLQDYPLILGPVFTEPPVEPGLESRGQEENARVQAAMRLCSATSLVGVPAVTVPTGVADGLPRGVQVIGGPYKEELCLDAAAAIEERLGTLTPKEPRS